MMKIILFFVSLFTFGQAVQIDRVTVDPPGGACNARANWRWNQVNDKVWACDGASWKLVGTAGVPSGTVTSVGFSTNLGTVTGSPVTTSGTLTNTVSAAQVVGLFSTCSGTQYLGADGACHTSSGTNYWTLTGSDIYNNNAGNVGIGGAPGNYLLDVVKSASTGTAQFYDQTATTGSTLLNIRNGAGQGGQVVQFRDNSNNIMSYILSDGAFGNTDVPGNRKTSVAPDGFGLADDVNLRWQNSINWGAGSVDTGIGRNAAGVVELNNGTLGTYRDLIARDVTVNSQAGGGTQCAKLDNNGKISGTGRSCGGSSGGGGHAFGATFSNSGSVLSSGTTAYFVFPFACSISAYNITTSPADTATLDIWKIASGTSLPTIANTIVASAPPTISTGSSVHSTTLTGWTTSVSANDIVGIHLTTVGGSSTQLTLNVECN